MLKKSVVQKKKYFCARMSSLFEKNNEQLHFEKKAENTYLKGWFVKKKKKHFKKKVFVVVVFQEDLFKESYILRKKHTHSYSMSFCF